MKKVLITGSGGRIGGDIKEFLADCYKIVEVEKNDKLSKSKFAGVHSVIHLAALTPKPDRKFTLEEYLGANVELTKQVLAYAFAAGVESVIIPTSWSWMFKVGDYQYSKLIQEKVAGKYRELGLNVINIELPEVIDGNYSGVISSIVGSIERDILTTVDAINITTITTKDIANVCKKLVDGKKKEAMELYKKSLKTFDLYKEIKKTITKTSPGKLKYLKKGEHKVRTPVIKNKTIVFPKFELE